MESCRRIIRFSLIGGGQIRVIEHWTDYRGDKFFCPESDPQLLVSAHTDQGLRRYRGHLSHGAICEMATYAVVFGQDTPQSIADRTAATLRAIDCKADNFQALLDGSSGCAFCGCAFCGRALKDEVSKPDGSPQPARVPDCGT